uniref:Transmembrane channel-like protein n=1 Tax=Astyanax mexicanus TaxID=7994 RepID=W5LMZ6_ASTMX
MACSVDSTLDICQAEQDSECSMEDENDTSSCMDNDFETVEMDFVGHLIKHNWVDEPTEKITLTRKRWSAATQRVLSSMPSRSVEWTGVAAHSSPRVQSQASSNRDIDKDRVPQRKHLLATLQARSVAECARMLRSLPLSLKKKREVRAQFSCERGRQETSTKDSTRSHFPSWLGKRLSGAQQGVQSLLNSVQLWHEALKQVSGRFGTGVLSYFLFLRTLLLYNFILSMITIPFLVLPQVTRPSHGSSNKISFTGLEILTGTGVLTNSLMFYGYYNYTDGWRPGKTEAYIKGTYNIRLAYILTIGIGLFVTCIMLIYSVFKTLGTSSPMSVSHGNLALKVFSSWDFKISKKVYVQQLSENICTHLKVMLCELHSGIPKRRLMTRLIWLVLHCTAWAICLTCIFCCVLGIYRFSHDRKQFSMNLISEGDTHWLILPLLVCGVNHLIPCVFNMLAWMESYDSFNLRIYIAIIRNLFLKVSMLGVLCYHWLDSIAAGKYGTNNECWETFVGQELYRFLLMDFLFSVLDTIFGNFLWSVFTRKILRRKRKPVFDIALNVLELIYGQTLAWLGILFSPLLPTLQIVKLFLLFYLKRASLMMNYQGPLKPWRATQMTTIFISILCFPSFLGATACITYTMWRLKPSATCGPFRTLSSMFLAGKEWRKSLEISNPGLAWVSWIYMLLGNHIFLFIVAGIFLLVIYIHIQVGDGQRRVTTLLQKQIENEVEDKKFLISKLQTLHEQHE